MCRTAVLKHKHHYVLFLSCIIVVVQIKGGGASGAPELTITMWFPGILHSMMASEKLLGLVALGIPQYSLPPCVLYGALASDIELSS